ncbi:hypothetical protein BJ166DRAFT_517548 [Pestalotiopsis sp. NC0098]|nr:hypothetical protein BJ166DRAFT_517548 [Pestalotiopsis sp. NC0098]
MDWGYLLPIIGTLFALFCLWYWDTNTSTNVSPEILTPPRRFQNRPPLQILYEADGPIEVDVIAVHGLGSHVDWSWTYRNGTQCVHWLRDTDMLPSIIPKSRIMVYIYESKWHADAPRTRLQLCGEELMNNVHNLRTETKANDRPIIFIGHSMGGNVILYGLLHAEIEQKFRDLLRSTVGLLFLGTPFRGTKMKWRAKLVSDMLHTAGSHDGIIQQLGYDNPELRDKLHNFCRLREQLKIPAACFFELCTMEFRWRFPLGPLGRLLGAMVVEEQSACIQGLNRYPLDADHTQMNKYTGPKDRSFAAVSTVIREMYAGAGAVIQDRQTNHLRGPEQNLVTGDVGVPRDMLTPQFSGRIDILNSIAHHLSAPKSRAFVLCGSGGMGKTQIALKHLEDSPNTYGEVLWIQSDTNERMESSFRQLAGRMGVDAKREDLTSHLLTTLSKLGKRVLLIYDGLDDQGMLEQIKISHKPRWKGATKVLITTRNRRCLELGTRHSQVNPFEDLVAMRLLRERICHAVELQSWQEDSLSEICSQLGNLPLAIQQAASYMATTGMQPENYLSVLKDKPKDVLDCEFEDCRQSVLKVWEASFQSVKKASVYASDWLLMCSFLDTTVPWTLFETAYCFLQRESNDMTLQPSRKRIEWLFKEDEGMTVSSHWALSVMQISILDLQRFCLIMSGVTKNKESYSMLHPLVQQWARLRLPKEEQERFMGMAMSLVHICAEELRLRQLALGDDRAIYDSQRWLLNHTNASTAFCTQIWKQDIAEVVPLECTKTLASFHIHAENYPAAEIMLRIALRRSEDQHSGSTVDTQRALARTLRAQGEAAEALRLQLHVVEELSSLDRQHAVDDIELLHARSELATIYRDIGKFHIALRLQEAVLEEFTEKSGSDSPDTLHEMSCLASIYANQKMFEKAREISEKVLQVYQGISAAKPETKIYYTKMLATILYELGEYRKAMALEKVVLEEMTALYGHGSLEAALAMRHLAATHKALGEYDATISLCSDALKIYHGTVGKTHRRAEKTRWLLASARQLRSAAADSEEGQQDDIGQDQTRLG